MHRRNLLVHLHNDVDAFSIKPRHLDRIREAFPDITLIETTTKDELRSGLPAADWLLTWSFRPAWYQESPRLEAVFTPAAGNDWVPPDPTGRVRNFYGQFHGRIMRESLLAMMLYFNRRLALNVANQERTVWDRGSSEGCSALFSQRVLIVGYGAIGRQMAELLKAFGARITGVRRNTAGSGCDPHAERVVTFDRLEEELPVADHVVLMLPGGVETTDLFTERHFARMKPGSYLYNLGRGNCYREEHLVHALLDGPLAGAGLDVFREEPLPPSSPLWKLPNVLITPHASAISREYLDLYIEEWIETFKGQR
ncbi:D-2-hydroxyacid dehydrogenase [Geobacter argillaceus]|uniref:Phosphoglycerate dehydrogenase-like enzyme n=1 Tax=Geobacter argillaceus TaxID=345631 RepID=A0A562VQ81_9BACT|nr:D-2-hydroxyacid dehydrogenase [Geobacter argillaceus]TWJ19894.1 phosphoglycerate dehydrogenase-like enzyme [Geobacter argillaceus]